MVTPKGASAIGLSFSPLRQNLMQIGSLKERTSEFALVRLTLAGLYCVIKTKSRLTFKYDPFGRRIEKISPTTTSIFAYDSNNLIETVNSSGGVVARYAQAPGIDQAGGPVPCS